MKVLHVHGAHVPTLTEGISRNVHELVGALAANGVPAQLAASPVSLDLLNKRRTLAAGWWWAYRRAAAAQDDGEVLIHLHAGVMATALGAGRLNARGPVVVHLWNALLDEADRAHLPAAQRRAQGAFNGPAAARLALRRVRHAVVSSRFQADQLRRAGFAGEIHVVPNGVDTSRYQPGRSARREEARERLGVAGDPVFLYYGHLSPSKGVDVLLDAMATVRREHPAARLLLAVTSYGAGAHWLRDAVARRGLQRTVVESGVGSVRDLHAAADIAVLPARTAVGTACFPNVLLECMSAGLPVVATRVGAVPEALPANAGLLAAPGDAAALADGLQRFAEDPALARRMGQAARNVALGLDWAHQAEAMQAVYAQVLGERSLEAIAT